MTVRTRLYEVAAEKSLRQTTIRSYETLLNRIGLLDMDDPSYEQVLELIWTIDNTNSRRATIIAIRSVLGMKIKIPRAIPRRYDLPDEDTLRLALMTSPHEIRGLLMMYAGLRVGEACAITANDVHGDRLQVDRQMVEVQQTGKETIRRIGPVKSNEASVVIPHWLTPLVETVHDVAYPMSVRESLRRAGHKVGVHINPHMLRHWYATTMLARGIPLALVSRQMRHSDVAVTLRAYSQFQEEDIHNAFG
jgi:integrase